jgi:hypothetical protein
MYIADVFVRPGKLLVQSVLLLYTQLTEAKIKHVTD